jgi:hypothetical protein
MGIFRRKPQTFQGTVPRSNPETFTLPPTDAHSIEEPKPEVARRSKRRPHPIANKKKPTI